MIAGYKKLHQGHIWQETLFRSKAVYDLAYVKERYDAYSTTKKMSRLRLSMLKNTIGNFESVLDVGYGNGDFLAKCREDGIKSIGFDISGYPLPIGVERAEAITAECELITFFDSLEHFQEEDLTPLLRSLNANYIAITCPLLHDEIGGADFEGWKHRRPDEHFHHFTLDGLRILLASSNYRLLDWGSWEDAIRRSLPDGKDNTITVVAQR